MIVIGVDPGPTQSAFVVWDGELVMQHEICPNKELRDYLEDWAAFGCLCDINKIPSAIVFEQVESFGMAVGRDVFETVFETGRMFQVVKFLAWRMPRREVKMHLCHSMRAKDSNIQAGAH